MTRDELVELTRLLRYYSDAYHLRNESLISNAEYDAQYALLEAAEAIHGALPNSPTQLVGGVVRVDFQNAQHRVPMLSLKDVFVETELTEWQNYCLTQSQDQAWFIAEPKLDGLALSLTYEGGVLVQALTRGDGQNGEVVTTQALAIRNVPTRIAEQRRVEFRGEAMITREQFRKLNENGTELANCRNGAAGAMRQKDPRKTAERGLRFYCYQVLRDQPSATQQSELAYAKEQGFEISLDLLSPYVNQVVGRTEEWLLGLVEQVRKVRDDLPVDIDGLVFKVTSLELQQKIGWVSRTPKWAAAWKYYGDVAVTELVDIVDQVGRTGVITPRAVLKPVRVGGVTVSSATLHNYDEIARLGVRPGVAVMLERAGDVIPKIRSVLPWDSDQHVGEYTPPTKCPACCSDLVQTEDQVALRCPNTAGCPAQSLRRLLQLVSRKGFDIEGVAEATLVRSGVDIANAGVLWTYDAAKWQELGLGPVESQNVVKAFQNRLEIPASNYFFGLGIPGVGETTAKLFAKHYANIRDLLHDANRGVLIALPDVGVITQTSVAEFGESNRAFLESLDTVGVTPLQQSLPDAGTLPLTGRTYVITGTFENYSREQAQSALEALGARVSSSVSKTTTAVFAGANAGSKLTKAQALGVPVLGESDLILAIGA